MQSHKLTLDQAVGSELAQKVRDAKEIKSYDMTKEVIREVLEAHNIYNSRISRSNWTYIWRAFAYKY